MVQGYCLFCDKDNTEKHQIVLENEFCYARKDNFPVSEGHLEIVPKIHLSSFFDLSDEQLTSMYALIKEVKAGLEKGLHPDGYNVGINEGEAAGRTIHHLHIHLIPRYVGDVENPRGGVRNVIPGKGSY